MDTGGLDLPRAASARAAGRLETLKNESCGPEAVAARPDDDRRGGRAERLDEIRMVLERARVDIPDREQGRCSLAPRVLVGAVLDPIQQRGVRFRDRDLPRNGYGRRSHALTAIGEQGHEDVGMVGRRLLSQMDQEREDVEGTQDRQPKELRRLRVRRRCCPDAVRPEERRQIGFELLPIRRDDHLGGQRVARLQPAAQHAFDLGGVLVSQLARLFRVDHAVSIEDRLQPGVPVGVGHGAGGVAVNESARRRQQRGGRHDYLRRCRRLSRTGRVRARRERRDQRECREHGLRRHPANHLAAAPRFRGWRTGPIIPAGRTKLPRPRGSNPPYRRGAPGE